MKITNFTLPKDCIHIAECSKVNKANGKTRNPKRINEKRINHLD